MWLNSLLAGTPASKLRWTPCDSAHFNAAACLLSLPPLAPQRLDRHSGQPHSNKKLTLLGLISEGQSAFAQSNTPESDKTSKSRESPTLEGRDSMLPTLSTTSPQSQVSVWIETA